MSIPGHERRIVQAWVNVKGGMRVFAVNFLATKVQAVRIANTRHVWSLWRQRKRAWRLWLIKEEGAVVFIPEDGRRIARPSLSKCQRWVAGHCLAHLAPGRMDTEK